MTVAPDFSVGGSKLKQTPYIAISECYIDRESCSKAINLLELARHIVHILVKIIPLHSVLLIKGRGGGVGRGLIFRRIWHTLIIIAIIICLLRVLTYIAQELE